MGSNGIFVTLMVLQRDTNTVLLQLKSRKYKHWYNFVTPNVSTCWARLLSKKGNRTLCLHFLKHHFTTRQGPKTPVASSLVWSVKPHEIYSPILFAPGIHVEGFFFTCRHVSSWVIIFCCKVTHENYQSILREFPYCSALTLFLHWRRC